MKKILLLLLVATVGCTAETTPEGSSAQVLNKRDSLTLDGRHVYLLQVQIPKQDPVEVVVDSAVYGEVDKGTLLDNLTVIHNPNSDNK